MIHGDDILVTTNIGGSQVAVAACKSCNFDTITLVSTALYYLSKKYYIITFFLNSNAVVPHRIKLAFKFCKFMIMSCKQSLGSKILPVCNVLYNSPCNG